MHDPNFKGYIRLGIVVHMLLEEENTITVIRITL